MGGIHYWRAPFTPLLSSVVVIRVSSMYLRSLPSSVLSLSTVSASMLPCLFCHQRTHTHTHTLTRLTQQLILILNLFREKENEFRRRGVSLHGCLYQYLYIDLALPLLLHSSRYRLVFPAGISAYNLTDGWSAWGRVYWTGGGGGVSHMPLECVRPLNKKKQGGDIRSWWKDHFYLFADQYSWKDKEFMAHFYY